MINRQNPNILSKAVVHLLSFKMMYSYEEIIKSISCKTHITKTGQKAIFLAGSKGIISIIRLLFGLRLELVLLLG